MTRRLDRRAFLRHLLTLSVAGSALSLAGCRSKRAPTATPARPLATAVPPTPTAVPPTATALPPPVSVPLATSVPPTPSPAVATATTIPATPTPAPAEAAYLAVARGASADPKELTRRAIAAIGGIERFVKKGADVIIKPNICNAYNGPEYASTTNPDVVAALIALCLGAGASRVRVMDYPFAGAPLAAYDRSGITAAARAAGGEMEAMSRMKWRSVDIPQGKALKKWDVYGDILDADLVINVPIAKNHGSATLTLGMKNLMGVVSDRTGMHARGLHQSIADLNTAVRPQLTVVDAVRILVANGPTGGSLDDVKRMDTVIASTDVVAADAYATTLFGMKPVDIGYIRIGSQMGIGNMDLKTIRIEEIAV